MPLLRIAQATPSHAAEADAARWSINELRLLEQFGSVSGRARTVRRSLAASRYADTTPIMKQSSTLLELASSEQAERLRVVFEILEKTRSDGAEETQSLAQQTVSLLEDEWASITSERERVIGSLSRIIADPQTDLLSVNILAYALASAGEDGVTELLGLLEHDDFSVNTYAAEGIGALDNRARWAVPALIRFLERARQPWTHYTIIRALGNIGGAEAISVLQAVAAGARQQAPADDDLLRSLEGALAAALVQP